MEHSNSFGDLIRPYSSAARKKGQKSYKKFTAVIFLFSLGKPTQEVWLRGTFSRCIAASKGGESLAMEG
jgi:hypothetical protein